MSTRQHSILIYFITFTLIGLINAPISFAISPNGVDIIRGSWGGMINSLFGRDYQLNLYFNEFGPDPNNPNKSNIAVASGGISISEVDKNKRAKVEVGPIMARYESIGNGDFILSAYGTAIINDTVFVIKLNGIMNTFDSGVEDDSVMGTWQTDFGNGTWQCSHFDRRKVNLPSIAPEPPSELYFNVDVLAGLWGPPGEPISRSPHTIFQVDTNIVSGNVKIDFPTGESLIIDPFTDIFSPDVDFINIFRFYDNSILELPTAGGIYVFTALDILGNPIPGVQNSDIYIGGNEPDPPINVKAEIIEKGILVTWDPVPIIPGSFDPEGVPPIGAYLVGVTDVYGAAPVYTNQYIIPHNRDDFGDIDRGLPLNEMGDGIYFIEVRSNSDAPAESGGKGMECHSTDPNEFIFFEIKEGMVILK